MHIYQIRVGPQSRQVSSDDPTSIEVPRPLGSLQTRSQRDTDLVVVVHLNGLEDISSVDCAEGGENGEKDQQLHDEE